MWFRQAKTPPTEKVVTKGDLGICPSCVTGAFAGDVFICGLCELEKLRERVEELEQAIKEVEHE